MQTPNFLQCADTFGQRSFLRNRKMALPLVGSISDLTDLEKTVFPFAPQLYDLPQQVFHSITDAQALKSLYWSTNPLISAFAFSLFLAPIFLLASEINRNYSQVDRCWSILPTVYIAHFVYYTHGMGLPTARLDALLAASILWSVRSAIPKFDVLY